LTFNSVFRIFKPSERESLSNLEKEGKEIDWFVTIEKYPVELKIMEIIFSKKKNTDKIK